MTYLSVVLAKQKKGDFRPKNDELAFSRLNTEPCVLACEFLERVRDATTAALSGRNKEVFLTEVGVTFHTCVASSWPLFCLERLGRADAGIHARAGSCSSI